MALTGCQRNFFAAKGDFGTDGPTFGTWASPPQGCSRDPKDGLPDNETRTAATFVWEDPADHNILLRDHRLDVTPDSPDQVNLLRVPGGGYNVRLKTKYTDGTLITPRDCSTFDVQTQEQAPGFRGGRPALSGRVRLECNVKQSRVWASFTFDHCDY